jgi:hypothetical protein
MACAVGATVALALIPGLAFADPPPALPGGAPEADSTHQPAMDYDTDGCYPTPAIGPDGTLSPGLNNTGNPNGACHDESDLDNTNAYSRSKCNNGWCAFMYTLYFEKDQAVPGPVDVGGHRHDWEHIVVWVNDADQGRASFVSASRHGGFDTKPANEVLFEGSHPKIVYHKDGGSTHAFRFAGPGDEPPENHKHTWQYPTLVGWDNYPPGIRDKLTQADFGHATMGIRDGTFEGELKKAKPDGIPFDPNG